MDNAALADRLARLEQSCRFWRWFSALVIVALGSCAASQLAHERPGAQQSAPGVVEAREIRIVASDGRVVGRWVAERKSSALSLVGFRQDGESALVELRTRGYASLLVGATRSTDIDEPHYGVQLSSLANRTAMAVVGSHDANRVEFAPTRDYTATRLLDDTGQERVVLGRAGIDEDAACPISSVVVSDKDGSVAHAFSTKR